MPERATTETLAFWQFVASCCHPETTLATVLTREGWLSLPHYCPRCWSAPLWERGRA